MKLQWSSQVKRQTTGNHHIVLNYIVCLFHLQFSHSYVANRLEICFYDRFSPRVPSPLRPRLAYPAALCPDYSQSHFSLYS